MSAGDRNSKNNRVDYAKHYSEQTAGFPICGQKNYGYSTPEMKEVDCEKCKAKLKLTFKP